jgi:hypothetical protein
MTESELLMEHVVEKSDAPFPEALPERFVIDVDFDEAEEKITGLDTITNDLSTGLVIWSVSEAAKALGFSKATQANLGWLSAQLTHAHELAREATEEKNGEGLNTTEV